MVVVEVAVMFLVKQWPWAMLLYAGCVDGSWAASAMVLALANGCHSCCKTTEMHDVPVARGVVNRDMSCIYGWR